MANGEDKSKTKNFYQVLGLNKECTATELRNAYKKLAMRWHPDRCSASGNSKFIEESKQNFQAVQQAYSVLSDHNKRFLYDVGVYDSYDDENGMGDFLNEMAVMMSQTNPYNDNGEETFEDLQELFEEMFRDDIEAFEGIRHSSSSCGESSGSNNGSNSSQLNLGNSTTMEDSLGFGSHFQKFSLGVEHQQNFKKGKGARGGIQGGASGSRRRSNGRWETKSFIRS